VIASFIQTLGGPDLRRRLTALYGGLLLFNLVLWALTIAFGLRYPVLLGAAILAYGLGLRHAVDPDHIAAIDNTTRKLMQEGQRPVAVGFFFSLGHSSIVVLLSAALALSTSYVKSHLPGLKAAGTLVGTSLSAAFLVVIGLINLVVLVDIYRQFRRARAGAAFSGDSLNDYLDNRGLLARLFKPALRLVDRSWKMYPVGFLFGLGFDTASEVGLLGLSAAFGANGQLPVALILLLPLLFTAGMSLADTTDGVMMLGAYGWAFVKPIRKLYYNLSITFVSVVVALVIGGIEALQVIGQETGQITSEGDGTVGHGAFWAIVNRLDLQNLGLVIVAVFLLSWLGSTLVYRLRGYDHIGDDDSRPGAQAA
jgi:high-affinity nickel-transport protein